MATTTKSADATISRFHWEIEILLGVNILFSGFEISTLSSALAQIVKDWSLSPAHVGGVITASGLGALLGAVVIGNFADRFGRKAALQVTIALVSLGTALSGLAWDFPSLAFFQFLAGLGAGGSTPCTGTFITEFAPAKYRGRLLGLADAFWVVGWVAAATLAYFLVPQYGWRVAFFLGVFPILYIPIFRRVVPESPRYLFSHGRTQAALGILRAVEEKYGLKLSIGSTDSGERMSNRKRFMTLWSPELIRRTICTWILWFVAVYSFNGIFMWMPTLLTAAGQDLARSFEYAIIINAAQLPAVIGAAILMDYVGRKRVLVLALALSGIAAYFFGQAKSAEELLLWGCAISFWIQAAWATMLAYTPELYPTRVRGTGVGLASACGRFGGVAVPGVITALIGGWGSGYAILFWMFAAVLIGGGLAVATLGEETMGRSLEDIAA